ncbi:hypothetical protein C8R43DRAFT_945102 [Mycena crocata]|nr:hypothetical protein C8R43DRAFT_945102 [Mycena crocata]
MELFNPATPRSALAFAEFPAASKLAKIPPTLLSFAPIATDVAHATYFLHSWSKTTPHCRWFLNCVKIRETQRKRTTTIQTRRMLGRCGKNSRQMKKEEQRAKTRARMARYRARLKELPLEEQMVAHERARIARARYRDNHRLELRANARCLRANTRPNTAPRHMKRRWRGRELSWRKKQKSGGAMCGPKS